MTLLGGSLTDILNTYQPPHPETSEKKDLSQQTIILVVDGLHNLPDDLQFNGTLAELANLSHGGFRLVCVTSAFRDRIETALKPSRRLRIYLPIEPLNPPTIRDEHGNSIAAFHDKTPLGQLLVRDCGGHGRALEILWNLIKGKDLKSTNLKEIMHDLKAKLTSYYPMVFRVRTEEKEAIVRAAFVHPLLYASDPLSGTGKTPDELCAPGLVWFEEDETATGYGRLKVAYICIWAMANSLRDPILRNWSFDDYSTLLEKVNEAIKPSWEEFKRFNIRFRCLKSQIFEKGKLLTLTELHYGAKITGDIAFRNRHLTPSKAIHHTDTHTNICNKTQWLVTSLEAPILQSPVNEVHQYKLYSGQRNIREAEYQKERQKAASSTDFFILYTTQEHSGNISLPQNSALVCQDNWDRYYGSFAGRAFIYGSGVGGK
ncbi:hypothetical protein L211DRAFT_835163 [Terfezia boudieri ATCC MYA-4762]|uniref:Uncharacterized protein n=1 Tax=Terfezia boudieri ATCC MYA-4762 TaxID=1051890 RepID=A0A3N4LVK8_9PEZI|nr:hypothetical protein L211DRAFT_835163 [Terfezia boudieri ATCC MYA-4762]